MRSPDDVIAFEGPWTVSPIEPYDSHLRYGDGTEETFSTMERPKLMFDVKVKSVRLMNVQGKLTRVGRTFGKRKDWKKAYVRLQEGFDINYGEEETTK